MNRPAVEMDERLAFFTLPAGQALSGFLVVFADDVVADRIDVAGIHGDGLSGFRGGETSHLLAPPLHRRSVQRRGREG